MKFLIFFRANNDPMKCRVIEAYDLKEAEKIAYEQSCLEYQETNTTTIEDIVNEEMVGFQAAKKLWNKHREESILSWAEEYDVGRINRYVEKYDFKDLTK